EPDHVAAVTTLAGRTSGVRDALRLAFGWALGHTTTVALAALVLIVAGVRLPERWQSAADLLVALVLIVLGASVLVRWMLGRWHLHSHSHGGSTHLHLHSHAQGAAHHHVHAASGARWALGVGLLHG